MPLYSYYCGVCHTYQSKVLSPEEAKGDVPCRTEGCSGKLTRKAKPPSSNMKEVYDNGAMHRKVEVFPDIQEIMRKRADDDTKARTPDFLKED